MIDLAAFTGDRIAVLGLGKTGLSSARALQESGATVLTWDDDAEKRAQALASGITVQDLTLTDFDFLLISPGIPHSFPEAHPVAARAKALNKPIFCDIELLCAACPDVDMLAITGTNGKSTTTALIGHILKQFRPTAIGGNIGTPVMTLPELDLRGTYVLEMSSYQLELTPSLAPAGAILLNITPDHIERHGSLDGYIAAKEQIFAQASSRHHQAIAVIGIDTEPSKQIADRISAKPEWRVIRVSTQINLNTGIYVANGKLYDAVDGTAQLIADLGDLPNLKGQHNHENAACAYALIRNVYGYEAAQIIEAMHSFPGLPHRQYPVRTLGRVVYINDSKATNADAAARALACYDHIYWIIGGLPKDGGLNGLEQFLPRIRHTFLIGKAAPEFAQWLDAHGAAYTQCGTLDRAVGAAHEMAQASQHAATVLLSPACASWDQFKSFEHRGDVFAELVNALPKAEAA